MCLAAGPEQWADLRAVSLRGAEAGPLWNACCLPGAVLRSLYRLWSLPLLLGGLCDWAPEQTGAGLLWAHML